MFLGALGRIVVLVVPAFLIHALPADGIFAVPLARFRAPGFRRLHGGVDRRLALKIARELFVRLRSLHRALLPIVSRKETLRKALCSAAPAQVVILERGGTDALAGRV